MTSTMLLGDEFQVTLASNVKSNARNKPTDFENALAKTLDLLTDWEVDLIDLSYLHNWVNLDKPFTSPFCPNLQRASATCYWTMSKKTNARIFIAL